MMRVKAYFFAGLEQAGLFVTTTIRSGVRDVTTLTRPCQSIRPFSYVDSPIAASRPEVKNGEIGSKSIQRGKNMAGFKIKVARIEMISPNERGEDVSLTFQFEGRQTTFTLPIFLNSREFDDTEIVKVARSKLHDVFRQLYSQCENWQLTDEERRELASINVRPT
jgi:hypothetical protein